MKLEQTIKKDGMKTEKLTVHKMQLEDCWKDMARIPGKYRLDVKGKRIHRATICDVMIGDKHKLLIVRGCTAKDARILLDSQTRHDLGVEAGAPYEIELRPVGWLKLGYWRWAWKAADPAYRIASQVSLIALFLGLAGLVMGLISLCRR